MHPFQFPKIFSILWVEEAAQSDYANWIAPINMAGCYDIKIAEDTTQATECVQREPFDVILVDIRLPPGNDPRWINIYNASHSAKYTAQLGMAFIHSILGKKEPPVAISIPDGWVTAQKIGILSVESESMLKANMDLLDIHIFQQKSTRVSETVLLELVQRILKQQQPNY